MIGAFTFTLSIFSVAAFCSECFSSGDQTKGIKCKKRHHFEEAGIINTVLAPETEIADKDRGGWKMGYNLPGHDCIVLIWFCMTV